VLVMALSSTDGKAGARLKIDVA